MASRCAARLGGKVQVIGPTKGVRQVEIPDLSEGFHLIKLRARDGTRMPVEREKSQAAGQTSTRTWRGGGDAFGGGLIVDLCNHE